MKRTSLQRLIPVAVALLSCAVPARAQTAKDLPVLTNVQRELKGGETHAFRIALTSGQFLDAAVQQQDIDIVVSVFGPDGKQLTESDSPNGRWGPEPVLIVAGTTGEYRVDVRSPNNKAAAGLYQIQIVALREATQTDKDHAAAQLTFDEARKLRSQQTAASIRAAIEKFEQALRLFQSAGDAYRRALTSLSIGMACYPLNEYGKALDYFNQTLALAVSIGDRRLEAVTETWLGGVLDVLGDVVKALDHHKRALELARENNWSAIQANALNNIGTIYNDAADWQKALEYFNQALPVFRALGAKQNEAKTLGNIGTAYSMSGEQQKALDYLQQSLPLLQAGKDRNAEAYTLVNIGRVYFRLEDYEKSLEYYNRAQTIQRETGNRAQEGETLDDLGQTYAIQRQYKKALEYHRQALEIQQAVGNVLRQGVALINLGRVYNLLQQPHDALPHFTRALELFRGIDDLRASATALEGIARAEQKLGNFADARKHIEESLALIETVRVRSGSLQLRASYRASVEKAYEFYIDLLMQQGKNAEALKASERGRARSLLERLGEALIDIRQGVDPVLLDKERDLMRVLSAKAQREMQLKTRKGGGEELAAMQREISELEDEYQQVQAAIRKSSPQYAALTQPQPLDLKGIQQQLDPNTVLLEYSLGEERSYLWVITPDSLKTFELPKREQIEKVTRDVSESLTARSVFQSLETSEQRTARIAAADAKLKQVNAELSRMILAPAVSELGNKRLVIVPDGGLQYVPFAALPLALNRPLILDHEVVSLQSASAFAVQRQNLSARTPAPKAVAVIADPVFSVADARFKSGDAVADGGARGATRIIEHLPGNANGRLSISRLPFTRAEADQILTVSPRDTSMKAVDFRANRSLATSGELSKYRYVHFATHGYVDTTRADLSAIVLSLVDREGKPLDGFLRVHDIYNLNLPAELVVLSACETGLGKEVTGEGLVGLTRAFMYAGARRLIVSLWNVNDKATASLMQRLYVEMLRSGKTPAASLRAAQIEMLRTRQWQSPYYWAAFVMQGEWN